MRRRPLAAASILAALALAGPWRALRAEPQSGARPGAFVLGIDRQIGGSPVDPAQREAASALATSVLDILRRDPAVASPTGYSVRVNRATGKRTDWAHFDSGLPFYAGAFGTLFSVDARPNPGGQGAANFGIYANTVLGCPATEFQHPGSKAPWRIEDDRPVLIGERRTGELHGYPIYDRQCVVLSTRKDPPFVPLTRERFLRLRIQDLRARLASVRTQYAGQATDETVRAAIDSAVKLITEAVEEQESALAAMSDAERAAPSYVRPGDGEARLVDPDEDGAEPLTVPNPAFFDRARPPSVAQILAVYLPYVQSGPRSDVVPPDLPEEWRPAMEKIRDGLDWAALEALLRP